MRQGYQKATTIAVEIKYSDFRKTSKQMTIDYGTDSGTEIFGFVKELFSQVWTGQAVRLLGVRTTNLLDKSEPEQMSINDFFQNQNSGEENNKPTRDKLKKLDEALDLIKGKYGEDAVYRASLMKKDK